LLSQLRRKRDEHASFRTRDPVLERTPWHEGIAGVLASIHR
jgi:hypothetical protein